jgi:hypothetical protein
MIKKFEEYSLNESKTKDDGFPISWEEIENVLWDIQHEMNFDIIEKKRWFVKENGYGAENIEEAFGCRYKIELKGKGSNNKKWMLDQDIFPIYKEIENITRRLGDVAHDVNKDSDNGDITILFELESEVSENKRKKVIKKSAKSYRKDQINRYFQRSDEQITGRETGLSFAFRKGAFYLPKEGSDEIEKLRTHFMISDKNVSGMIIPVKTSNLSKRVLSNNIPKLEKILAKLNTPRVKFEYRKITKEDIIGLEDELSILKWRQNPKMKKEELIGTDAVIIIINYKELKKYYTDDYKRMADGYRRW